MAARTDAQGTGTDTNAQPPDDQPDDTPEAFAIAVAELRAARLRPELLVEEVPGPQRVAPYSFAITADVVVDETELGTGRLVLLHDPDGHEAWRGTFRCVTFVRAEIEPEMVTDPLLGQVAWSWLTEALAGNSAVHDAASGTITRVASEGFGGLVEDPARAEVEIRASWTPVGGGIERHMHAWGTLLGTAAGLPPVGSTVASMPRRTT